MIKKLAFVMYIVALYPVYTQDVGDSYISIYREIKASDQDTIQQRAYLKVFLKKCDQFCENFVFTQKSGEIRAEPRGWG